MWVFGLGAAVLFETMRSLQKTNPSRGEAPAEKKEPKIKETKNDGTQTQATAASRTPIHLTVHHNSHHDNSSSCWEQS